MFRAPRPHPAPGSSQTSSIAIASASASGGVAYCTRALKLHTVARFPDCQEVARAGRDCLAPRHYARAVRRGEPEALPQRRRPPRVAFPLACRVASWFTLPVKARTAFASSTWESEEAVRHFDEVLVSIL